jgi:hypothetical protein
MKVLARTVRLVSIRHVHVVFNQEKSSVGVRIRNHLNVNQSAKRKEAVLSIFVMKSVVDSEHLLLLKIILVS